MRLPPVQRLAGWGEHGHRHGLESSGTKSIDDPHPAPACSDGLSACPVLGPGLVNTSTSHDSNVTPFRQLAGQIS